MKKKPAKPARRYMRSFKLNEISAVDAPAQEHARAAITKRATFAQRALPSELATGTLQSGEPTTLVSKRVMLTTAVEGHTHLLDAGDEDSAQAGTTDYQSISGTDSYSSHSHPWARSSDGTIVIGEAAGHTHELLTPEDLTAIVAADDADVEETDTSAKRKEATMANEKSENEKRLETELAKANKILELTNDQREHYAGLSEPAKSAFLSATSDDRDVQVAKKRDANPVVFTAADGTPFYKNDDPRLVKQAKELDEHKVKLAKRDAELETERLEKRATTDLPNLKGSVQVRAAILKAIDGIADETIRKEAHESLAAADGATMELFKNVGHGGAPNAVGTPLAKFNAELALFAKAANKDPRMATSDFLNTPRGAELYAEAQSTPPVLA